VTDADHLLSSYAFELPEEQIAKRPLDERSASRLMVLEATAEGPRHGSFRELLELLREGDALVVNDTTVIPARLYGEKASTGGRVEVLLSRAEPDGTWVTLVNASKRPRAGQRIIFGGRMGGFDEPFFAEVLGPVEGEPGAWRVRFEGDVLLYAEAQGSIPLPPYLERDDDEDDRQRYQTVYADADKPGAVAAPTAGLHFDDAMLQELETRGVRVVRVTLHVGPGTFLPVRSDDVRDHAMHAEPWVLPEAAARQLNETREAGGRIVAVGTTATRVLEAALEDKAADASFEASEGLTRIFIRPGYRFRAVDALITNFHLPESTLLMLVAAVSGRERILAAYEEAIAEGYRFYSYGDACFLEVREEAKA
jgi:S-adenosylmethionine:tRNA ribosyltransferase-isomerase